MLTDNWQLDTSAHTARITKWFACDATAYGWAKRLSGVRITRADGRVQCYACRVPYALHHLERLCAWMERQDVDHIEDLSRVLDRVLS